MLRRSVGWHWPGAIHEFPERVARGEPNHESLFDATFFHFRQEEAPFERNSGLLLRRIEKMERSGRPPVFDDLGRLGVESALAGRLAEAIPWADPGAASP